MADIRDILKGKHLTGMRLTQEAQHGIIENMGLEEDVITLDEELREHREDEYIHVSEEDRQRWDDAAVSAFGITTNFDQTISRTDEYIVFPFRWNGVMAGDGTIVVMVTNDNIEREHFRSTIQQGLGQITMPPLPSGRNDLVIFVIDSTGAFSNFLTFTIETGGLEISIPHFNPNPDIPFQADTPIVFDFNMHSVAPQLAHTLTVRFFQGRNMTEHVFDQQSDGFPFLLGNNTVTFPNLFVGAWRVEIVMHNETHVSNMIQFNIIVLAGNTLVISSEFTAQDFDEEGRIFGNANELLQIPYRLAMMNHTVFMVSRWVNGVQVREPMMTGTATNVWNLPLSTLPQGINRIMIRGTTMDGSIYAEYELEVFVHPSTAVIDMVTQGLVAFFDPRIMDNSDRSGIWRAVNNPNITAELRNFNYSTNGWIDGELQMNGTAHVEVNLAPFSWAPLDNIGQIGTDGSTNLTRWAGLTIDMCVKSVDIGDMRARIFDCTEALSPHRGFNVNMDMAHIRSNQNQFIFGDTDIRQPRSAHHLENEYSQVTLVMAPQYRGMAADGSEFNFPAMFIYVNGIAVDASPINNNDIFFHTENMFLNSVRGQSAFGSCSFRSLRVYNRALEPHEVVQNFIFDIRDPELQQQKHAENFIQDASSLPTITLSHSLLFDPINNPNPGVIIENHGSASRVTCQVEFTDLNNPNPMPFNGGCSVHLQGSSTLIFPSNSYRFRPGEHFTPRDANGNPTGSFTVQVTDDLWTWDPEAEKFWVRWPMPFTQTAANMTLLQRDFRYRILDLNNEVIEENGHLLDSMEYNIVQSIDRHDLYLVMDSRQHVQLELTELQNGQPRILRDRWFWADQPGKTVPGLRLNPRAEFMDSSVLNEAANSFLLNNHIYTRPVPGIAWGNGQGLTDPVEILDRKNRILRHHYAGRNNWFLATKHRWDFEMTSNVVVQNVRLHYRFGQFDPSVHIATSPEWQDGDIFNPAVPCGIYAYRTDVGNNVQYGTYEIDPEWGFPEVILPAPHEPGLLGVPERRIKLKRCIRFDGLDNAAANATTFRPFDPENIPSHAAFLDRWPDGTERDPNNHLNAKYRYYMTGWEIRFASETNNHMTGDWDNWQSWMTPLSEAGERVQNMPPTSTVVNNVFVEGRDSLNWLNETAPWINDNNQADTSWNDDMWDDYTHPDTRAMYDVWIELIEWVHNSSDAEFRDTINRGEKLDKEYLLKFYIYMMTLMMVDNGARNTFFTTWDGELWFPQFWDLDTGLGLRNTGTLTVRIDDVIAVEALEDFDPDSLTATFNANNSLLWTKVGRVFWADIQALYRSMRQNSLSETTILNAYTRHHDKISEMDYNTNLRTKYSRFGSAHFDIFHGDRMQHIRKTIRDRLIFLDTLFGLWDNETGLGPYLGFRSYYSALDDPDFETNPPHFMLETFATCFVRIEWMATQNITVHKIRRGERIRIDPHAAFSGGENIFIRIANANLIRSVGDLTRFKMTTFENAAPRMTDIVVRDAERLTVDWSSFPGLRHIDIEGSHILTVDGSVNLAPLNHLEYVNMHNTTGAASVMFNHLGGVLRTVRFPIGIQTIDLRNQPGLTTIDIPYTINTTQGYRRWSIPSGQGMHTISNVFPHNISEVRIENCQNLRFIGRNTTNEIGFDRHTFLPLNNIHTLTLIGPMHPSITEYDFTGMVNLTNLTIRGNPNIRTIKFNDMANIREAININGPETGALRNVQIQEMLGLTRVELNSTLLQRQDPHQGNALVESSMGLNGFGRNPGNGQNDMVLDLSLCQNLQEIECNYAITGLHTIIVPHSILNILFPRAWTTDQFGHPLFWPQPTGAPGSRRSEVVRIITQEGTHNGVDIPGTETNILNFDSLAYVTELRNIVMEFLGEAPHFQGTRYEDGFNLITRIDGTFDMRNFYGTSLDGLFHGFNLGNIGVLLPPTGWLPTVTSAREIYRDSAMTATGRTEVMSLWNALINLQDATGAFRDNEWMSLPYRHHQSIRHMDYMYAGCKRMERFTLDERPTHLALPTGLQTADGMYLGCEAATWDPAMGLTWDLPMNLHRLRAMFDGCSRLTISPRVPNNANIRDLHAYLRGTAIEIFDSGMPLGTENISNMFENCTRLMDAPPIPSSVNNMDYTFSNCRGLRGAAQVFIPPGVTSTAGLFRNCGLLGHAAMNYGENVTDASQMYEWCHILPNAPAILSNSIENMDSMFFGCEQLQPRNQQNQQIPFVLPNRLITMRRAFAQCSNLEISPERIPDNVINMEGAFALCNRLRVGPTSIGSSVHTLDSAFVGCPQLELSIPTITENVISTQHMYRLSQALRTTPAMAGASSLTNISGMFWNEATQFAPQVWRLNRYNNSMDPDPDQMVHVQTPNPNPNHSAITTVTRIPDSVTNISNAFANCRLLEILPNIPSRELGVSAGNAFQNCVSATSIHGGHITFPSVQTANGMFQSCNLLTAQVTNFPDNLTSGSHMFAECHRITFTPNLQLPTTLNNGNEMFRNCLNLETLNTTPPPNLTSAAWMFAGCSRLRAGLTHLPPSINVCWNMYTDCTAMTTGPTHINSAHVTTLSGMFSGCSALTNGMNMSQAIHVDYITNIYADCLALTTMPQLPPNARFANGAFRNSGLTTIGHLAGTVSGRDMFRDCGRLGSIALNAPSLQDASFMFTASGVTAVTGNSMPASINNAESMFQDCVNLTRIPGVPPNIAVHGTTEALGNYRLVSYIRGCVRLVEIHNLDLRNITSHLPTGFMNQTHALMHVNFPANSISINLPFNISQVLTDETLANLLRALIPPATGTRTLTITNNLALRIRDIPALSALIPDGWVINGAPPNVAT